MRPNIPHNMSWSAFRMANECPAAWHAKYVQKRYKPASTEAMALGVYAHAAIMGHATARIEADFATLLNTKGGKPTAKFARTQEACAWLSERPYIQAARSRFLAEEAVTIELNGATWLCFLDWVNPEAHTILDIKYTADGEREQWVPRLRARGNVIAAGHYGYQLAIYRAAAVAKWGGEPHEWTVGNLVVSPVQITASIDGGPEPGSVVAAVQTPVWERPDLLDRYADRMARAWTEATTSIFREPVAIVPALRAMRDGEIEPPRCEQCEWCIATEDTGRQWRYREIPEYE